MRKIFFGMLLVLWMVPVSAAPAQQDKIGTDGLPWWNDRVFYEVFVRAYADSNGDGNGDLKGLISKLNYLNDGDPATTSDLGVTGLWLMPIMQSPSYHGYDITDYEQIESDYGTNDDFKQLVEEAHKRGIAVIIDMVLNHTARDHAWFQDSLTPGSEHDSWYIWSDTLQRYSGPWGETVWNIGRDRFYYAIFQGGMPDLNYRNPDVTQAMYGVADFWLNDMGVDGFRLDAVKHLIEDGRTQENTPETFDWLKAWEAHLESVKPDVFTVGEVQNDSDIASLYVPDSVDTVFAFDLAGAMVNAAKLGKVGNLPDVQKRVLKAYELGQYGAFLTNHDQNRIMNELHRDFNKVGVAASLLLTQPGVPFIYYGEEIGMTGIKPDECIRTMFQWDDTKLVAPFMKGKNCKTNQDVASVTAETGDSASLLSHYRDLIRFRTAHPALQTGDMTVLDITAEQVYSFIRHDDTETLLVVINLSGDTVSDYQISGGSGLTAVGDVQLLLGAGEPSVPTVTADGGLSSYQPLTELAPYSTTIIALSH
ncbi:MAG: alpha-amylase family glycosyl hydrolase [Chloroflexota bacterium]